MKKLQIEQNSPEWLEMRKGKITGSKLADIVVKRGTGKKIGFYQLLADRLAVEGELEDFRERGHRLENEAITLMSQALGKEVDQCGMWLSDDNSNIAVSPDGVVKGSKDTEAVEIKCLNSALHIKTFFEQEIPDDYKLQALQYFIVNEKLKKLHFGFFDPRVTAKPFFVITIERNEELEKEVEMYREYQLKTLEEIEEMVSRLAF